MDHHAVADVDTGVGGVGIEVDDVTGLQLVARHRNRIARANELLVPWTVEPLGDLNTQQRELEQVNTELGFLFPYGDREDHGQITYEGRFRVWKELWLLNYFGVSARY